MLNTSLRKKLHGLTVSRIFPTLRNFRLFTLCAAMSVFAGLAITVRAPAEENNIHFTPLNDPQEGPGGTRPNAINDLGVVGGNYTNADGSVYPGFVATPPYSKESFTTVAVSGAVLTNIWGVNLEGAVTGYTLDTSNVFHGFVSQPPYTTVTTFDAPGACSSDIPACADSGTFPYNINLEGAIAGYYVDANGVSHGFVTHPPYTQNTFTTIDAPGACSSGTACSGLGTVITYFALNDLGVVTGEYLDANQVAHGFVSYPPYTKHTFTTTDAPDACEDNVPSCPGSFNGTAPESINLWGVITGTYAGADGVGHGFVSYPPYTKSTFTSFDAGVPNYTIPSSINLEGVITGFSIDTSNVFHGFVTHPPYTTVTTFDAPGACFSDSNSACAGNGTDVYGVNLEGVFTGFSLDASGNQHGFVARQ
jgi:hypothetical protein